MDERVVKFRVGVMVLATLIMAGILMLVFGNMPGVVQRTITVFVKFPQAPGVAQDTPVRKSGILIGRVSNVEFAADGGVIVTLKIDGDVKLRRDEACVINTSLLGDTVLQFVATGPGPPAAEPIADGDYLQGRVAADPLQMMSSFEGNFGQAVLSVSSASDEISKLAQRLNTLLAGNEDQLARILGKTERTLDSMQRAMGNIDSVLGDEQIREDLRTSIGALPELLQQTRMAMNSIAATVDSANRNLKNLEGLSRPLGERGEGIIAKIDNSLGRLDSLLEQFTSFGRAINRPEGSIGRLLNEPEFYDRLQRTMINIEELTRELKPIVRDARVFTDKIARHPETLGVRGALQRNPGTK